MMGEPSSRSDTPARLVVLISGNGTNLQAVLDACAAGNLPARVVAVFSNKLGATGLQRAQNAGIPAICVPKTNAVDRCAYDANLAEQVEAYSPDWVLLLGWMHILGPVFLNRFTGKVINIHPALPGAFPGTRAIERAYAAFEKGEITQTGVMVHLVPDEGVDSGPVLGQMVVPIFHGDSLQALEARMHHAEHALLLKVLHQHIPAA